MLTILVVPNVLNATQLTPAREQDGSTGNGRSQINSDQAVTAKGDARSGKELFGKHCATCHGPRGKGDGLKIVGAEVADLASPSTQQKLSADLMKTIHEGRPEKVMPAWKWRLSEQQTKDVLAYLRTLRK
ncbi:MAG TPA: cytochrome c [Nitrospira sp.]|nr:cytochrome c [Nitrospira sp.]